MRGFKILKYDRFHTMSFNGHSLTHYFINDRFHEMSFNGHTVDILYCDVYCGIILNLRFKKELVGLS